jgi:hypothetical protein
VKNLDYLIERLPDTAKLFVWGEMKGDVKLQDNVFYKGPIHPDNLRVAFSMIDCLIIPSVNESFSFVAREAIGAGMLVVGGNLNALRECIPGIKIFSFKDEEEFDVPSLYSLLSKVNLMRVEMEGMPEIKSIEQDARDWSERYRRLAEGVVVNGKT